MYERIKIIQQIINLKKAKIYLEIGVQQGDCFINIKAPKKIGIDPNFLISKKRKLIESLNYNHKYYNMTSDEFFTNKAKILKKWGLDVAFIDGLHTHEQTLIDILNVIKYLNEDGVIVLHDCNPPFEKYAKVYTSEYSSSWCGDVWKTIVHLRSTRKDLKIFVLDYDFGLGIISRGNPENLLSFSPEDINKLSYKDLENKRKELLNLKKPQNLNEIEVLL